VDEFLGAAVEAMPPSLSMRNFMPGSMPWSGPSLGIATSLWRRRSDGCEGEGILQAMGDQQRCAVGDVALLHDQLDDGG